MWSQIEQNIDIKCSVLNTFLSYSCSDVPFSHGKRFQIRKVVPMENMPTLILLGIGVLLVIIVILFVLSSKKQDKEDAKETEKMLEGLEIDLKDASEDIDDTAAALSQEDKDDDDLEPEAPAEEPPEELGEPEPEKPEESDKAEEPEKAEEPTVPEDIEIKLDDMQVISDEMNAVVAEPGVVPSSDSIDPIAPDEEMNIFDTGESSDDMSELDALFGASSDVEELVLAGSQMDDGDILEDLQDDDFLAAAPKSSETSLESEPLKVIEPKPSPPKPAPKPKVPAQKDPEDQKRHDKAKRIARVIVNDIRNYNTDKLAEGIQMGNIMKTLGKEVERGRLLYIKRVSQEITRETNYYREALIKILADGQPDLLGL